MSVRGAMRFCAWGFLVLSKDRVRRRRNGCFLWRRIRIACFFPLFLSLLDTVVLEYCANC
jgi:hypothetical protein